MTNRTIGETICTLRKEKGMTQKELAEALHVTDKAVSKWERGGSLPDTATIPYLAEILGVSIETLMQAKSVPVPINKEGCRIRDLALKAIPTAMGVAVTVCALLGKLDTRSGLVMLGLGLASAGVYLLGRKE